MASEREPDWRDDALCTQIDAELFHPRKGDTETARLAKRTCLDCPVRRECLIWALANDERWGIWGGIPERARRPFHQMVHRGADPEDVATVALHGREVLKRWTA